MTTEHAGSGNLNRSMELLWQLRDRPHRGPKPGLTVEQIVDAAIRIADADGLEALSMRRVATELDVGTMSLYRYVPGKAELLDLMLDRVHSAGEMPDEPPQGWRDLLERSARAHWETCLRHRWYPFVDQARPVLGPNGLAGVEYEFGHLRGLGLSDQELAMVISLVYNFVEGLARVYIAEMHAEERTGISNEEFWAAQEPALVAALDSGRYPTMAGLADDTFSFTHAQVFEFGLPRLLDGLEQFIDGRRRHV